MKGIYLTEAGKRWIESQMGDLEWTFKRSGERFDSRDSGMYSVYKKILSEGIVLPVEESWSNVESINPITKRDIYSNGVIIKPKGL